jgi:hypothetical protein
MLLEDRLTDSADRRRALEQTQKALARVGELTQEGTRLANWLEVSERSARAPITVQVLLERVVGACGLDPLPHIDVDSATASVGVSTIDGDALVEAVTSIVKATTRELRKQVCTVRARSHENRTVDLVIGPENQVEVLLAGPDSAAAGPLALERGGLGLSLIAAAMVLEAHRAVVWTADGSRTTVGIRLPIEERPHQ